MDYKGTSQNDNLDQHVLQLDDWTGLWGLEGDDTLSVGMAVAFGGAGNDRLIGTSPYSVAGYFDAPSGIKVNLSTGVVEDGFGSRDQLVNIYSIQGSSKGDTVEGSSRKDTFWSFGNGDYFDGGGGIDTARISIVNAGIDPTFKKTFNGWTVSYTSNNGAAYDLTLVNVEILEIYRGNLFQKWDLTSASPGPIPEYIKDPKPSGLDTSATQWAPKKWGLVSFSLTENVGSWYYPTKTDYHPPSNLGVDFHNAALGDFNGDGYQDIAITWSIFPHVIPHATQLKPTFLFGSASGLTPVDSSLIPESAMRHQGYRTWAADLNGDGLDDLVTGASIHPISATASDGATAWTSDPTLAMLSSRDGRFVDISDHLEGQSLSLGAPSSSFDHATAAGDLNGDGIDDIFSGNNLWISDGKGQWLDRTSRISGLLPNQSPMSLAIGDLNGDGIQDIAALYPDFAQDRVVLFNQSKTYPEFIRYDLPPGLYGSNTKDNNVVLGDVNLDGLNDIIISETRALPYYVGSAIQILIQEPHGKFVDQTRERIDNSSRELSSAGEGVVWFLDVNGDGYKDIVHSNTGDGIAIFLNDRSGHFSLYANDTINFIKSYQLGLVSRIDSLRELPTMRAYPVDDNHDGIMDLLVQAGLKESASDPLADYWENLYLIVSTGNEFGRNDDESLEGSSFDDTLYGVGGNDRLTGAGGNDQLDGGSGSDTVIARGPLRDYKIAISAGRGSVVDTVLNRDGADTLQSIEHIRFSDFDINTSTKAVAASVGADTLQRVSELYVAFFNRTPDGDGMAYWLTQAKNGMSIHSIAESFYSAGVQYTALTGFSSSMTNQDFINVIYRNVLGRKDGADAGGLRYWTDELESGAATRGILVSTILDSAHSFKGDKTWGWVADLLDNKITVAKQVSVDWGLNYLSADASIANGMAIAKAVTATDTAGAISLVGIPADAINGG